MAKLIEIPAGDLLPVGLFVWLCDNGLIYDRHGFGLAVTGEEVDTETIILPSERTGIPPAVQFVLWFDEGMPVLGR